ncbi:MAG: ATP-binding protein [Candidatus Omnitrophota bacterium]
MGKEFWFFIVAMILVVSLRGSAPNMRDQGIPFIRNYSSDEYQAGWQNWDIVQDHRGVIYFANQFGVLEYDGTYWNLIELPNHSRVRSLAVDVRGTVYVCASGEFGYLASDAKGKLTYVSLVNRIPKGEEKFYDVWDACINSQGVYFITPTKIFRWYDHRLRVIPLRGVKTVRGTVAYDRVFVTLRDSALCVIHENRMVPLPRCEKICTKEYGSICVLPYPDGHLILLTKKGDFFLYDLNILRDPVSNSFDFTRTDVPESILKPFPTEISAYITPDHNERFKFRALTGNRYAVTTQTGGVIMMDRYGRLVQVINKARGLKDDCIWDVYEDQTHNLWMAANTGVSYVETGSPVTRFDDSAGLNGYVLALTRLNGTLIASTFAGIFYLPEYRLKLKDDHHKFIPLENVTGDCWSFFRFKDRLWAGVQGDLLEIDSTFHIRRHAAASNYSLGSTEKFPDFIFLGLTGGRGLSAYRVPAANPKKTPDLLLKTKFKGIDGSIRAITTAPDGDLWLTSSLNGIFHVHFTGNNIDDYRVTHYTTREGLPGNDWNFIYFFNRRLILATPHGIYEGILSGTGDYHFIPEQTFGQAIPPRYRKVSVLATNEQGTIWVCSQTGIGMLHKHPDGSYRWNAIPFKPIPEGAEDFFPDQDGLFWVTSAKGLFRFDSRMPKDYRTPYNALIRKVTVGRHTVLFHGTYFEDHSREGGTFTVPSLHQPHLLIPTIAYADNSLFFEFSSTFYEHARENRFKYILEGFDKEWSTWTQTPQKEYTNLPEGRYRFRLIARNIYDHQSREAVFRFTVSPPWFRTLPAYLTGIVLIGGFLGGFAKLYLLRRKSEKNLRESEEKLRVMGEKIETVSILSGGIAHDFNNLLSIIIGNLSLVSDEADHPTGDLKKYVNAMEIATAQATELVKQFITLSKAYGLNFQKLSLTDVLKQIGDGLPPALSVRVSIPADLKPLYGDERQIRQVIANLLLNAYEAQSQPAVIRIHAQNITVEKMNPWNLTQGDYVNMSVIDSGKGISPQDMDKVFDPYFSTKPRGAQKGMGMGLAICYAIIKKHNGHIAISSEPDRGTMVDLYLPVWGPHSEEPSPIPERKDNRFMG